MQLHQLKPKHKLKKRKRIGRGGKRGTYSGRGIKGQKARAGRRFKPVIREFIKKYPKLRGYKFKSQRKEFVGINIGILERRFETGQVVSPETLLKLRLIHKIKGKMPKVKILGEGEITKKLIIMGCEVSKSAKEKIEEAGGIIK
jgi:large subunit ribosomal protein L15